MRQSSSICLAVLFAALLSPDSAYCQGSAGDPWAILNAPPGVLTDRINVGGNEATPDSYDFSITATAGFTQTDRLKIDAEFGRFLDKVNGITVRDRTVDNTETARNELTYGSASTGMDIGSALAWRPTRSGWIGLSGAISLGRVEVSSTNSQQAETTYESPAGLAGYSVAGGAGRRFAQGTATWSLTGFYEYSSTRGDDLARTPALNPAGLTVLSESNEFRGQSSRIAASVGLSRMAGPVRVSVSGDGGYTWKDVNLVREVELQSAPGVTTQFTGESDLSKRGAYGAVGGALGLKGGFSVTARGFFGVHSGFSLGAGFAF